VAEAAKEVEPLEAEALEDTELLFQVEHNLVFLKVKQLLQ